MANRTDCNNYALHRLAQTVRALQILRETLERRYSPDEVVDNAVETVETELSLLKHSIQQRT